MDRTGDERDGSDLPVVLAVCGALAVAAVGLPLAVLELGGELPRRRIDSGVAEFEGPERKAALRALGEFHLGPHGSEDPLLIDARVTRLRWCPGVDSASERRRAVRALDGYGAEVEAYALFGLPRGTLTLTCEGRARWD